jgi:hypothetical protein
VYLVIYGDKDNLEDDNKELKKADKMSHSDGLNFIKTTPAYNEQQR